MMMLMPKHNFCTWCRCILSIVRSVLRFHLQQSFARQKILKSLPVSLWPPTSPYLPSSSFFLHLRLPLRAVMVSHKEFVGAGKQPGLQVWRIENLDLKPVPKALHGSFYTGDAYLLLFTTSAPSYNIHMWLGKTWTRIVHLSVGQHVKNPFFLLKYMMLTVSSFPFIFPCKKDAVRSSIAFYFWEIETKHPW